MRPGDIVFIKDRGAGMIIDYSRKFPYVGRCYPVLIDGKIDWLYPEIIFKDKNEDSELIK